MSIFHRLFTNDKHMQTLIQQVANKEANAQLVTGLTGGARPAVIQALFEEMKEPIYVISSNLLQAQKFADDMRSLIGEQNVYYYPADEFIAANIAISSPELRAQRIATLEKLVAKECGVYIIPIAGMRNMVAPFEQWKSSCLSTHVGDDISLDEWLEKLVEMGYTRNQMVTTPGEFALRGGILDI